MDRCLRRYRKWSNDFRPSRDRLSLDAKCGGEFYNGVIKKTPSGSYSGKVDNVTDFHPVVRDGILVRNVVPEDYVLVNKITFTKNGYDDYSLRGRWIEKGNEWTLEVELNEDWE